MTGVIDSAAHLSTRREKINVLANEFADAMISKRQVMRVVNDPVMNEQMKIPRLDELFEPTVRVLYGKTRHPTRCWPCTPSPDSATRSPHSPRFPTQGSRGPRSCRQTPYPPAVNVPNPREGNGSR